MGMFFRLALAVIKRKRQKKRIKQRSQTPEIPMDLVMEIFMRLPAKSLMRFKCVSKLCSSLMCSKYFSDRFLSVSSPRIYMCLSDLRDHRKSIILSSAPTSTSSTPSCFVVDHDLTIPRMSGCHDIFQNFCGFMLYQFSRMLQIYNPATRQLVSLPVIKSNLTRPGKEEVTNTLCYYLGHDPVNDQYKVICSMSKAMRLQEGKILSEHWIFVLKAGGFWKKAAPTPEDVCPHMPVKEGFSINGVLYYLGWTGSYNSVVVSFDIRSENFKMIQVPLMVRDAQRARVKSLTSLIEYGGKVTLIDRTNLRDKGMVDLWVLEDAGNQEWSRKTLVLHPSQLNLVNDDVTLRFNGTTQNGKVFFIPQDLLSPFHVLCYDLHSNEMRKIEIKGIPDHWFGKVKDKTCFDLSFFDQSESIMYLET